MNAEVRPKPTQPRIFRLDREPMTDPVAGTEHLASPQIRHREVVHRGDKVGTEPDRSPSGIDAVGRAAGREDGDTEQMMRCRVTGPKMHEHISRGSGIGRKAQIQQQLDELTDVIKLSVVR